MKMSGTDADVIDALVGITPGSPLDAIRARRPEARAHAQATYRALFAPEAQATSPHGSVSRWVDSSLACMECHRRGLGGADRDAERVRAGARRPPASLRARRSGGRRRHPRRGLLQLGQSPDALAR